ncbi:hypothetical protein D3P52_12395 [Salmonella enterica]|uniref:Uncharacterized protein n=16 Tax=Salmonella enterica TaxID=28901 RepID=A0A3Y4LWT1_SALET|nr:hypothetical protein LFZ2_22895 [Salmonella enterica subsp. enterica serovar Blegdam str. S-1824]APZ64128.1 hypothetical protein LFZ29_22925 [Salmonella enterica subsp. enterica serovar Moscow str. S-1843]ATS95685.1 hypothetical protein BTN65_06990 [Salmonella enterica subsp. enterica serovar Enteritidis]AWI47601.1 hypothetical protein AV48_29140 [Salmonella enterica subsp. enterica serovar Enteritidis str. EC20120916]AWP52862.1 hypothetical protein SEEERM2968_22980 [Salmonella enterica subs
MQWLTVAMLSRPPTRSISRSISACFTLLIVKPHGRGGKLWVGARVALQRWFKNGNVPETQRRSQITRGIPFNQSLRRG